jgi:hypothetical protein
MEIEQEIGGGATQPSAMGAAVGAKERMAMWPLALADFTAALTTRLVEVAPAVELDLEPRQRIEPQLWITLE